MPELPASQTSANSLVEPSAKPPRTNDGADGLHCLSRIRCVLVATSHPGNIGAAARAMKNMGLSQLVLVQPKTFPSDEATARAAGATDLLDNARRCDSLAEALQGCSLSFGTTARPRRLSNAAVLPRDCASQSIAYLGRHAGDVALVFGRERSGLSNDELDLCQLPLNIPTNPDYSSLNLGAAVQLLSYEMRVAALANNPGAVTDERELATHDQLEGFYSALEQAMVAVDFLKPENPRLLLRRVRQLFNRAAMDSEEVNLLRGFLSKILGGRG